MANQAQTSIQELRQGRVSVNDIKWDLIRIIQPYDGMLESSPRGEKTIRRLFDSYLRDLKYANLIYSYTVFSNIRETAITFDVAIKTSQDSGTKKLKIHAGVYSHPWIGGQ